MPPAADAAGGAGAPKMASLLEALEAKATAKAAHILRQKQAGAQPASWRPKTAAEARRVSREIADSVTKEYKPGSPVEISHGSRSFNDFGERPERIRT